MNNRFDPSVPTKNEALSARSILLLIAVVFLSRLPFLGSGFGDHGDARLIVTAARSISYTGQYTISRVPGYPMQELLYSVVWKGGPYVTNGLSALFACVAAVFFALILRLLGHRDALWGGILLVWIPAVYIVSASSVDFTWGLALATAAYYLVMTGRVVLPALLIGLASGTRLTWMAMLAPCAIFLFDRSRPLSGLPRFVMFAAIGGVTGFACFLPSMLNYGIHFFNYEPYEVSIESAVKACTTELWGVIGCGTLAVTIILAVLPGKKSGAVRVIDRKLPRRVFYSGLLITLIYIAAFIKMPIKAAYLTPVLPVLLVALSRYVTRTSFRIFAAGILISPFFCTLTRSSMDPAVFSQYSVTCSVLQRPVYVDFLQGPILFDHSQRETSIRMTNEVVDFARREPGPSVILAGWNWQTYIRAAVMNDPSDQVIRQAYSFDCVRLFKPFGISNTVIQNLADSTELQEFRSRSIPVYYLPNVPIENIRQFGADPVSYGAIPFPFAHRND